MTKKARQISEPIFFGDSSELKDFLIKKAKALSSLQAKVSDEEAENTLCGLIYVCESVADLPYFKRGKIRSMPELIEAVKSEREGLKCLIEEMKPELKNAKKVADEAFKAAGSYLANKFEDEYENSKQVKARECIEEYEVLKDEFEHAEEDLKINWWLLGIINRPTGFFARADKIKVPT